MEKKGYREIIEHLNEIFPKKIALNVEEAANVLGIDRRTLLSLVERKRLSAMNVGNGTKKKYIISITALAKAMSD